MNASSESRKLMKISPAAEHDGAERRQARRYELGGQGLNVARYDVKRRFNDDLGRIVDVSATGVRVRTTACNIKPDSQIRIRLEMPAYAGICPFVDTTQNKPQPKNEWVGWLAVSRVQKIDNNHYDVAGRLIDMDEMDRGMLGLYLSTQPLAA